MKKRSFLLPLTAFILLIISCTVANKNKSAETFPSEKIKARTTQTPAVTTNLSTAKKAQKSTVSIRADEVSKYAAQKGYSTKYCFLIDMSIPGGRNRFFVYDLKKGVVAYSGLVAHGSCDERFLSQAKFSNIVNSGCSSLGRYKVGAAYHGQYGESFKLHGLDNSNSNAFPRGVVIHGYSCIPDEEIYPRVVCNSLGCPMVSYNFFNQLSRIIKNSDKPILLWIYR